MATIYRFIVEQKISQGGSGRTPRDTSTSKRTTAKKGKSVSFFGGDKGGVEHNRKMRAINPLLNRMTGGYWEKGMTSVPLVAYMLNDQTTHKKVRQHFGYKE